MSYSQYLPSQTDDDDSYFSVVLEQLLGFFIEKFGSNWKNLVKRNLSVLFGLILKHFKITNDSIELFLKKFDLLSLKSTNFWVKEYSEGNFSGLDLDGRRNWIDDFFYDFYPDIEFQAKKFLAWNLLKFTNS